MENMLSRAFALAATGLQKISDFYDHAGLIGWRALTDPTFLHICPSKGISLPFIGNIAEHYNTAKKAVQDSLFDSMEKKINTCDVVYKPDLKPTIWRTVQMLGTVAGRIPWGKPPVAMGIVGLAAVASYCFGGASAHAGDAMTAWQSAPMRPKSDAPAARP